MAVTILGAGNVGTALARGLVAAGESVVFGVPDPSRHRDTVAVIGPRARVESVDAALHGAALVILAVPYAAALEIAAARADWGNAVLVDATNPLAPALSGLLVGTITSGAEEIARRAHHARVVKAFNTTGAENLANPGRAPGGLFLPVAGDDVDARTQVLALARSLGFDAVDAGPLAAARQMEPFALLWIDLALRRGLGRDFALVRVARD